VAENTPPRHGTEGLFAGLNAFWYDSDFDAMYIYTSFFYFLLFYGVAKGFDISVIPQACQTPRGFVGYVLVKAS